MGLPLYRVDLASVVYNYTGETEKNVTKLLAKAEDKKVVLLLDEADAHYLLQRLETCTGIVILTSNSREKMDKVFVCRMDLVIDFTQPKSKQGFNKKK